jgi:hypothetical protein
VVTEERGTREGVRLLTPAKICAAVWLIATVANAAIILSSREVAHPSEVKGAVAVLVQLAATIGLLRWLGRVPTDGLTAAPATRRGLLAPPCGPSDSDSSLPRRGRWVTSRTGRFPKIT